MNRKAVFGLAFVMLFAFAATAMAKGGVDDNPGTGGHGGKTTTFLVRAGQAEQGGKLQLRARAKNGDRTQAFGASAVVHLASGDVSVTLVRHGKNLDARARVRIAADEAIGPITVDITVTYGATTQSFTVATNVVIDPDAEVEVEASPDPSPSGSPED
jgi:hypothetical protein